MSLVLAGGEDTVFTWDPGITVSTSATYRRATQRCAYGVSGGQKLYVAAPSSYTTFVFRFFCHPVNLQPRSGISILRFFNGSGTEVVRAVYSSTGVYQFQIWNGSAWANVSGCQIPFTEDETVSYTVKIVCGVSGSIEVTKNGILESTGSFSAASVDNIRTIWLTNSYDLSTSTSYLWYFSEFSVTNSESLVGGICETEAPSANGTDNTDGTGSYTDIDETLTSTADFVLLDTAGQKRSFAFPARDQGLSSVKGVVASAVMSREATGPQNARFYLIVGGTRYYSPSIALTEAAVRYSYIWEQNPSTSLPWTKAQAEAGSVEVGVEALA